MEWFANGTVSEVVVARLDQGDDLLESIARLAQEADIRTGVIVSCIATVDRCRLHRITTTSYPPEDQFVEREGPIEITSAQGIIADYHPHIHFVGSDLLGTFAGHLEPGSRVLYLAEVCVLKLQDIPLKRTPNLSTGVNQLVSA
ncbi:MAG: PPC domain-containing DNA-binding protein [Armatimonadota bacterium]